MNLTISFTSAKQAVITFLHRFHVMVFAFVVLVGLIFIVYLLYNIVISSTDTQGVAADTTNTTFDQATINRINDLKTRDQSTNDLDFSHGRTNPFVE